MPLDVVVVLDGHLGPCTAHAGAGLQLLQNLVRKRAAFLQFLDGVSQRLQLVGSGYSVSAAGDVNSDGLADLIIGAPSSDPAAPLWKVFAVQPDGTLDAGRTFFDGTRLFKERKKGLPDGLKVDLAGNVFATGPGGVLVIAADGTHLGTFLTGQATANCAFGGDGRTLYMTADSHLCRARLTTAGPLPGEK